MRGFAAILALGAVLSGETPAAALAADLDGHIALQGRGFPGEPLHPRQGDVDPSASAQVEVRWR